MFSSEPLPAFSIRDGFYQMVIAYLSYCGCLFCSAHLWARTMASSSAVQSRSSMCCGQGTNGSCDSFSTAGYPLPAHKKYREWLRVGCLPPALRERILSANGEVQMRGLHRWLWAMVAALVCALPGMAHHSFAAEFDANKTVTIKGVVSK